MYLYMCVCVYLCKQGGAVNRGLKWFFSSLLLIEAFVRPGKYWLVWAGPSAIHLFNFNLIFLATA
jgi:hypothetical protein